MRFKEEEGSFVVLGQGDRRLGRSALTDTYRTELRLETGDWKIFKLNAN